jgi:SanA protein
MSLLNGLQLFSAQDCCVMAPQGLYCVTAWKPLCNYINKVEYNEPEAMRQYALGFGVPDTDIILDYAGRRTYDTCYRAHAIFQVDTAILVTQPFHLPRALFLCNWLGVKSTGVETNNNYFRKISRLYWNTRELFANLQAVWDVLIAKPLPVLGESEPIFK